MSGLTLPSLALPPIVRSIWPWLLLLIGAGGGSLVGLRIRRRRMTYTNQNVGQLLAAAALLSRRPQPWTHHFGLALLIWPLLPLVLLWIGELVLDLE